MTYRIFEKEMNTYIIQRRRKFCGITWWVDVDAKYAIIGEKVETHYKTFNSIPKAENYIQNLIQKHKDLKDFKKRNKIVKIING
jgi:hypothetical protein